MGRKKVCPVWVEGDGVFPGGGHRCTTRTLRGSRFCNEHDALYEIQLRPCNGEAHQPGVDYDHCMVCAPRWGEMEILVRKPDVDTSEIKEIK